jgi:predicted nucleotidyltransferase component of viral defense system
MRAYAERLGFKEAYMAEKDYLQELLLRALFTKIPENRLVFRGGTALAKIYGSGRFSDDLDFVVNGLQNTETLLKSVKEAIKSINAMYETTFTGPNTYKDMLGYDVKINGPLFMASMHDASRQNISLDINTYESVVLPPINIIRTPIYSDIPPYSLSVKCLEELLMDKVAALMERKRLTARDLYDIWIILMKNSSNLDKSKVLKAYSAYNKRKGSVSYNSLVSKINAVNPAWKNEIGSLVNFSIDFDDVAKETKSRLKDIFKL